MRRLCKYILATVALAFAVSCAAIAANGLAEDLAPADAIVILGNQVHRNGKPSERLTARLARGKELFLQARARYIIVSGGIGVEGVDEAVAMRNWLTDHGIPPERIIVDSSGHNTAATARFCADLCKERGFSRVIAVTQYFHIPRTVLALEQNGVAAGKSYARFVEWRDLYSLPREVPAYAYYYFFQ